MAGRDPETERRKSELKEKLRTSRAGAARKYRHVSQDVRSALSVPSRVKASIRRNGWKWIGGTLAAGVFVGKVLRPGGKTKTKSGTAKAKAKNKSIPAWLAASVGKALFSAAKPLVVKLARKRLERHVQNSVERRTQRLHSPQGNE